MKQVGRWGNYTFSAKYTALPLFSMSILFFCSSSLLCLTLSFISPSVHNNFSASLPIRSPQKGHFFLSVLTSGWHKIKRQNLATCIFLLYFAILSSAFPLLFSLFSPLLSFLPFFSLHLFSPPILFLFLFHLCWLSFSLAIFAISFLPILPAIYYCLLC